MYTKDQPISLRKTRWYWCHLNTSTRAILASIRAKRLLIENEWSISMLFFNMIIGITMIDKTDTGFLNMTPSNAISRSVPKGHVRHLNDLVPVSWGKPFWVKPAINRIAKTSLSRNWSFSQECEPTTGTPTSKGPSKKQGRGANSKQRLALQCPEKENHHKKDL